MSNSQKVYSVLLGTVILAFVSTVGLRAQAACDEWVDMPVVVNVDEDLGMTDEEVDDIIDVANANLAGACIRLVRSGSVNQEDLGDPNGMTRADRDSARDDGEDKLPDGKGIKIDIVENASATNAGTNGVAVHRTPVVIVEKDDDPNVTGNTVAHEIGHVLTIEDHSDDPNNVMHPSSHPVPSDPNVIRGDDWDPDDANEIHDEAKTRGTTRTSSESTPSEGESRASGSNSSPKAKGAKRDGLYDPTGQPPDIFNPFDPLFRYADLREVLLFCDRPDDPASNTRVSIRLHGVYPNRPFNAIYTLLLDKDADLVLRGVEPSFTGGQRTSIFH